jgi:hypothetical protein
VQLESRRRWLMDLVKEMADALIMLIRVGVGMRVVYCLIKIGVNEEEVSIFKKRARNTVFFYVLAELIWELKELVLGYYY